MVYRRCESTGDAKVLGMIPGTTLVSFDKIFAYMYMYTLQLALYTQVHTVCTCVHVGRSPSSAVSNKISCLHEARVGVIFGRLEHLDWWMCYTNFHYNYLYLYYTYMGHSYRLALNGKHLLSSSKQSIYRLEMRSSTPPTVHVSHILSPHFQEMQINEWQRYQNVTCLYLLLSTNLILLFEQ